MTVWLYRVLTTFFGRWLLNPPRWTAYIGEPWDTFDKAPRNLYNRIWVFGQVAIVRSEG